MWQGLVMGLAVLAQWLDSMISVGFSSLDHSVIPWKEDSVSSHTSPCQTLSSLSSGSSILFVFSKHLVLNRHTHTHKKILAKALILRNHLDLTTRLVQQPVDYAGRGPTSRRE